MKQKMVLLVILLSITGLFADGVQPIGSGTEADPYQVATLDNLEWISTNSTSWSSHFIQTADIDAGNTFDWNDGAGFSPIGNSFDNYFSGSYNGVGYTISNLGILRFSTDYVGLFGRIDYATISNLSVENVFIRGNVNVGGLIGYQSNSSLINCNSSGLIVGDWNVGGLVGRNGTVNTNNTYVSNCYNNSYVGGSGNIGGLIGDNWGIISNCYNTGNLNGENFVGGLVGGNQSNSSISNSYNIGCVSADGDYAGALVGMHNASPAYNSFWNTETSGQTSSGGGGSGKTTTEMKDVATYTNLSSIGLQVPWDFINNPNNDTANEDLWDIDLVNNDGYPYHSWWQTSPSEGTQPIGSGTVSNPYQVEILDNLLWVSTTQNVWDDNAYFIQTSDIDASDTQYWNDGSGFLSIGNESSPFIGNYNGDDFYISNLFIDRDANYVGFFGYVAGSTISNVELIYLDINGDNNVGGLAGKCVSTTVINNCFVTGSVGSLSSNRVGGLVGTNNGSTITQCHTYCEVAGNYAGGLVGLNTMGGTISQCQSSESVNGRINGNDGCGGLVGSNNYASIIENCFSIAAVNAPYSNKVGGLVGNITDGSTISNSYSIGSVIGDNFVGGLVGDNFDSEVIDSFWNTVTSGQPTSDGGSGKNSTQMRDVATYTDITNSGLNVAWDFVDNPNDDNNNEDFWDISVNTNGGYPFLTNTSLVGIDIEAISEISEISKLKNNYPNPFNPTTTISFSNIEDSKIELSIFNIKGQKVKSLTNQHYSKGDHSIMWNGKDNYGIEVSSGVYFYKLKSESTIQVRKMLLLK